MSYGRIELPLGVALAGIGFAILLAEIPKQGPGGWLAIAGVLGILGTFVGMVPAWNNGTSLWRDGGWIFFGAWILVGVVFCGAVLFGAFLSSNNWWRVGLVILALVQLIVIGGPIFVWFLETRDKKSDDKKP